jgi:hypothetical protein
MTVSEKYQGHAPTITVEAKVIGRHQPAVSGWRVPLPEPPAGEDGRGDGALRLRELLAAIVRQEVTAFRQRQEERRLACVLSPDAIQQGAIAGKIDMGGPREARTGDEVDEDAAVAVALQAFEDGLYVVFLDGRQHDDLDAPVWPRPDSTLTFIRLVALAGG